MNIISDLEKSKSVEQIVHEDNSIWPIIKNYLPLLLDKDNELVKREDAGTIKILLKGLFRDAFWFVKIFQSNIWVFTNSERRYGLNDSYFDRVASGLLQFFPSYVLFENPIPKGQSPKKKLQKGERWVGLSWLFLLQSLIIKATGSVHIENLEQLDDLLGVHKNKILGIIKRYHAEYKLYRFLFSFRKPKAVFVVCYYTKYGLIKACKEKGVPVFELQHGLITTQHRAYGFKADYAQAFKPDYFLTYGRVFNQIVAEGHFVPKTHTLVYGYSFLNEVSKKAQLSEGLAALKERYKTVVCITGQLINTDKKLLPLIEQVAKKRPEVCFIYKPRNLNNGILCEALRNLIKWERANTYMLLKFCDLHLTIYSTCALESLALGTPTISVDVDGLYTEHLKKLIGTNTYNYEASSADDIVGILDEVSGQKEDTQRVKLSISETMAPLISKEAFLDFFNKVIH
ncbi:hypothetical protein [Ulvibacterium sp.]|uniref:hypothetical protein n=1 Tax=Ulvibacterium sp. TaxID=2665914 RepID=UPI003CC5FEE4